MRFPTDRSQLSAINTVVFFGISSFSSQDSFRSRRPAVGAKHSWRPHPSSAWRLPFASSSAVGQTQRGMCSPRVAQVTAVKRHHPPSTPHSLIACSTPRCADYCHQRSEVLLIVRLEIVLVGGETQPTRVVLLHRCRSTATHPKIRRSMRGQPVQECRCTAM